MGSVCKTPGDEKNITDLYTMNIKDNAKKFLGIAMVLSVLSIWGVAQTNQTATQKAGRNDETHSKCSESCQ
jgi:hypothetical protein